MDTAQLLMASGAFHDVSPHSEGMLYSTPVACKTHCVAYAACKLAAAVQCVCTAACADQAGMQSPASLSLAWHQLGGGPFRHLSIPLAVSCLATCAFLQRFANGCGGFVKRLGLMHSMACTWILPVYIQTAFAPAVVQQQA